MARWRREPVPSAQRRACRRQIASGTGREEARRRRLEGASGVSAMASYALLPTCAMVLPMRHACAHAVRATRVVTHCASKLYARYRRSPMLAAPPVPSSPCDGVRVDTVALHTTERASFATTVLSPL